MLCSEPGPVSLSDNMYYRGILWSLVTAKLEVDTMASLWNLTGTSAALLSRCLSDLRVIIQFKIQISQLRDFARSYRYWNRARVLGKHGIECVWGVVFVRRISTTVLIWRLSNIHLRISHEIPQPSITEMDLKITYPKFHSILPGSNELTHRLPRHLNEILDKWFFSQF